MCICGPLLASNKVAIFASWVLTIMSMMFPLQLLKWLLFLAIMATSQCYGCGELQHGSWDGFLNGSSSLTRQSFLKTATLAYFCIFLSALHHIRSDSHFQGSLRISIWCHSVAVHLLGFKYTRFILHGYVLEWDWEIWACTIKTTTFKIHWFFLICSLLLLQWVLRNIIQSLQHVVHAKKHIKTFWVESKIGPKQVKSR